ncbi:MULTISPECIES: hypothetical protein [unclassified Nitratiruptor]|uniref:hypothetical protein n=1 Tax=unclassified Nitratiruptor TaxID=2624044 RepID=UPI0019156AF3|nr:MULTISPECIES: hypothetical protein [unclassified Nitratiruptor]BCD59285.1 hypothetical protein NitYY0810_C0015 [Nitratiruptor sp. YY08-10]BCD63209.1 hypothetical protein NitYY0814_C0015 [Nitratiruptor sp. YY08-14]
MNDRVISATHGFKSATGSDTHLFVFILILAGILFIVIGGTLFFSQKERREKFKRFFQRLQKARVTHSDGKKLFHYMDKKFHGHHFLFFKEEKIAKKATKATGVKGEFSVFFPELNQKIKKDTKKGYMKK